MTACRHHLNKTFPFTIQGFQVSDFQSSTRPSRLERLRDGATYSVRWSLQHGVGLQGTPLEFPGLLLGDFNGDGNIDIAVSSSELASIRLRSPVRHH